ncbi:hypothetical protein ACHAWT_002932 [Skeletonema menzelii]
MTGQIRCHYDVLGVERDADAAIVKKAHRKLALKHHPDKTVSLDEQQREESAAEFKLIQAAYECLSDPVERKWYDEHRDMILRGGMHGSDAADGESSFVYDVTPFHFSGCYDGYDDNNPDNFYSVYAECFESIYNGEKDGYISEGNIDLDDMHNAHLSEVSFGNSQSKWEEVSAFYNSWEAFTTSLNFAWVDIYHLNDMREAPNRRIRRLMEDDNRKKRKAAKKERVEEVIALVRFVKKRDPRVRAQREQQLRDQAKKEAKDKKDAEERKKKREIAKQEWRIQQEIAMAEQEATDLDAGRIRLADLDSDDDYDYGGGKGKGRKKKKGKRRGKNNKSYDFDNEDTNEVDASVDATDGIVAESENDDTDRLEVNEEAGNDSTKILDDAEVDDSGSNIPDNDDMGDNDVEYDIMSSEEESESEEEPDSWRCECCRKDFKSAAQFENHTKSKKHKEKWKQYEQKLQKEAKQKAVEDLMDEIDGGN